MDHRRHITSTFQWKVFPAIYVARVKVHAITQRAAAAAVLRWLAAHCIPSVSNWILRDARRWLTDVYTQSQHLRSLNHHHLEPSVLRACCCCCIRLDYYRRGRTLVDSLLFSAARHYSRQQTDSCPWWNSVKVNNKTQQIARHHAMLNNLPSYYSDNSVQVTTAVSL